MFGYLLYIIAQDMQEQRHGQGGRRGEKETADEERRDGRALLLQV